MSEDCPNCKALAWHVRRLGKVIEEMDRVKGERLNWDHLEAFLRVWQKKLQGKWTWSRNMDCKYVGLWIDMRDGGCILTDKDQKRIRPDQLEYQHGKEEKPTPEPEGPEAQSPVTGCDV